MDDIVVFSKSIEEHMQHVSSVLNALTNANLRINRSKSKLGMRKVKLLGFLVSESGIIPDKRRLEDIFRVPTPTSNKEFQRFLGMTNYIRQHIPQYAEISHPLDSARMNDTFEWTPEKNEAFKLLKPTITRAQIKPRDIVGLKPSSPEKTPNSEIGQINDRF